MLDGLYLEPRFTEISHSGAKDEIILYGREEMFKLQDSMIRE